MRIINLGNGAALNYAGPAKFPFDNYVDEKIGVFQAEFQGAATCVLQGRMNSSVAYTDIATITSADASKIKSVALMPDMRMFISAWTVGQVYGFLGV